MSERYWHGGPRIAGDKVLPPSVTGFTRVTHGEPWVFVSTDRDLALNYACTADGWLYEVEPVGDVEQDPDSMLTPGVSLRCHEAHILRRYRPSRADIAERSALIAAIAEALS